MSRGLGKTQRAALTALSGNGFQTTRQVAEVVYGTRHITKRHMTLMHRSLIKLAWLRMVHIQQIDSSPYFWTTDSALWVEWRRRRWTEQYATLSDEALLQQQYDRLTQIFLPDGTCAHAMAATLKVSRASK